ncbi:hypothetical protein KG091_01450 [Carnobacteriaceae bacterium zg-ZUI78]|nr:hypothetical protein [Carnobacteriaceae bacterium zg-ZUI78]
MALYKQYLLFTLKNALRFPRQASKVIPGVLLSLLGIGYTIYLLVTTQPAYDTLGALKISSIPVVAVILIFGLILLSIFNQKTIAGFRYADANFLMPAPLTPFQTFMFVQFKALLPTTGLIFFILPLQMRGAIGYLPFSVLLIPIILVPIWFIYLSSLVLYIVRLRNRLLEKLIVCIILIGFVGILLHTFFTSAESVATSPFIYLYPLLGWASALIYGLASLNVFYIIIGFVLLTLSTFLLYKVGLSIDASYYETELAYINKTEQTIARASSGQSMQFKNVFKQSKKTFKRKGEKALLDKAWITAGRLWFVNIPKFIAIGILIVGNILLPSLEVSKENLIGLASVFILYSRFFFQTVKDETIINDTYLHLLPVKTVYKVTYPLIVKLALEAIYCMVFTLVFMNISHDMFLSVYMGILVFGLKSIDIFRVYNIQAILFHKYFGNFLQQVIHMILTIVTQLPFALLLFGLNTTPLISTMVLTYAFVILSIYMSIVVYQHFEKGKSE